MPKRMEDNMQKYSYGLKGEGLTSFTWQSGAFYLSRLFGMECKVDGKDPDTTNITNTVNVAADSGSNVAADRGCPERGPAKVKESNFRKNSLEVSWDLPDTGLEVKSRWDLCDKTGIWSRKDRLTNTRQKDITISRCLARFVFAPGRYEVYSQGSRWCYENEGSWQELNHGSMTLSCENGRTTQGGTPFVCIRDRNNGVGAVFHIIPAGNWVIRISSVTASGDSLPYVTLELGLAQEHLHRCIHPGQSMDLPEILIQELIDGDPRFSAPRLHRYLMERESDKSTDRVMPVVYNTWFDAFDDLNVDRLRGQMKAAKELGCEVFVVDAGWYGPQEGDWFAQAGDWREKKDSAFRGKMQKFAKEVRSTGLGFGLWMEPERIGPQTPVLKKHPEWFHSAGNGYFYPNLLIAESYNHIKSEIARLIETYGLAWMKLDFNFDLGIDPECSEFSWYYEAWYRLLEEIRQEHTDTIIEGCASGGMRLEMASQSHCDAHFLSDNVNPSDVIRINQGALLRLLPGRLSKWVTLRSIGNIIPKYGTPLDESPVTLITPAGATWDSSVTTRLDFAVLAAMPGVLGFSGDIAGLPAIILDRMRMQIDFYKKYRNMIYNSIGYLLTPMPNQQDDKRWVALQLQSHRSTESIVFVYRLDDSVKTRTIKPLALNKRKSYKVEYWDGRIDPDHVSGENLMEEGIAIEIPEKNEAVAIVITAM